MASGTHKLTDTTGIQLRDAFVVIVKTEWNEHVVSVLEQGCIEVLKENNINYVAIDDQIRKVRKYIKNPNEELFAKYFPLVFYDDTPE